VSTVRYVIYLRVSTDQQADSGSGLEIQEEACRRWLREHRHRLVEVCTDAGRSGSLDIGHRPGLARALALIGADRADGVLVYRLDRLARDLVLQEQLLAELHRRSNELASVDRTEHESLAHSPDDPTRALVRRILGSIAQYEREVIRLRLMAGRTRKQLDGGYSGGAPRYGYAAVRGQLVKIPAEQVTIRQILRLRAAGESYQAICDELARRGVKSRKKDGLWRKDTIRHICLREEKPRGNGVLPYPELAQVTA
jgi:DNA invertase Pin-like site-specific DNA recombinase